MQVKSPDKATAAKAKTLARLIQGNGANKAILHASGKTPIIPTLAAATWHRLQTPQSKQVHSPSSLLQSAVFTVQTCSTSIMAYKTIVPFCITWKPTCKQCFYMHSSANTTCIGAGAVSHLVKLVRRGSESDSAAGAAHALAAFTIGKNASIYRASLQAAHAVPALLMCAHHGHNCQLHRKACILHKEPHHRHPGLG